MSRGIEQIESYKEGMLEIQKQFPNCKAVASALRNLYTVEDGDWMGIYLKDGKFYESPVRKVHSFEAVGAGDAFGAGLIHAMLHDFEPQKAIVLCDFRKCFKADDPARCQCGERNRDRADHEAGRNESAEIG